MQDLDLSYFFQTKSQAVDFSTRLADISEKIYKTNFNLEKTLLEQFGIKKKDKLITILRNNNIDVKSNSVLKNFFTTTREQIATYSVLSVTLAFEPKEQTLKAMSEWFPLNIHKQVLFDVTVDPELIGGAVINYNGKFMDFSIRPKFNEILDTIMASKTDPTKGQKDQPEHHTIDNLSLGR